MVNATEVPALNHIKLQFFRWTLSIFYFWLFFVVKPQLKWAPQTWNSISPLRIWLQNPLNLKPSRRNLNWIENHHCKFLSRRRPSGFKSEGCCTGEEALQRIPAEAEGQFRRQDLWPKQASCMLNPQHHLGVLQRHTDLLQVPPHCIRLLQVESLREGFCYCGLFLWDGMGAQVKWRLKMYCVWGDSVGMICGCEKIFMHNTNSWDLGVASALLFVWRTAFKFRCIYFWE